MLNDIYQEPCRAKVDGKEFFFEYNHASYASFEKKVQKSIYEIFENITMGKFLTMEQAKAMSVCGLLKHHQTDEISEFEQNLVEKPGVWFEVKNAVEMSFLLPLVSPSVLEKMEFVTKKKEPPRSKKKKLKK